MKIKEGFILRTICGENVVSGEGSANVNFSKLVRLNDSAAYLFNEVKEREFDAGVLTALLLDKYDVDRDTAAKDAEVLVSKWIEAGIVAE